MRCKLLGGYRKQRGDLEGIGYGTCSWWLDGSELQVVIGEWKTRGIEGRLLSSILLSDLKSCWKEERDGRGSEREGGGGGRTGATQGESVFFSFSWGSMEVS